MTMGTFEIGRNIETTVTASQCVDRCISYSAAVTTNCHDQGTLEKKGLI